MIKHANARKYSRSQVAITAILTPAGNMPFEVEVADLSMGGMFVHTDAKLAPGTKCHIRILLGHFKHEMPIEAEGTIIRTIKDGVALKFKSTKIEPVAELQNLIVSNSDNPEKVAVEFSNHGGWVFNPEPPLGSVDAT